MKSNILVGLMLLFFFNGQSQVGIGTTTPKATLDISVNNMSNPQSTDGILIPRINKFPTTNPSPDQQGMMIYLTTAVGLNQPGLYVWDHPLATWLHLQTNGTLIQDKDRNTKVMAELHPNEDKIRFNTAGHQRMIIDNHGRVGIGGDPHGSAYLHVNTGGANHMGFVVSGSNNYNGSVPDLGYGPRLMFFPGKAAFRAGMASYSGWNDSKVGRYSVAMGWQPEATNYGTVALGNWAKANGFKSTAIGDAITAEGDYSLVMGRRNRARSFVETVMGQYSTSYTPNSKTAWHNDDRIFSIGINRYDRDGMVMLKNGRIGFGNANPPTDLFLKQSSNAVNGTAGFSLQSSNNGHTWKVYNDGTNLAFAENLVSKAYVATGTGAWISVSDANKKKNINALCSVLDRVNTLNPVTYQYKTQENFDHSATGFLAQEVAKVFPEMVYYKNGEVLGLNYSEFGVLAIAAIKEQQTKIQDLEKDKEDLSKEIQRIKIDFEQRLKKLENKF